MRILFIALIVSISTFRNVHCASLSLPCINNLLSCGKPSVDPTGARIVGGTKTLKGSWPWIVALYENRQLACGGVIISDDLLLTANHCFSSPSNNVSNWIVAAGMHRTDVYEPGVKFLTIAKIIGHENYDAKDFVDDIALVQLKGKLSFSSLIRPICLPTKDQGVSTGEMCLMAGWGYTKGTGQNSILNQVALPIISDDTCAGWYRNLYGLNFYPDTTFCAGYEDGDKDSCRGDSGGPLICFQNNAWYLQGISSWGLGCGEYYAPGVYTEVSKYTDWIKEQTSKLKSCPSVSIG